MLTEVQRTEVWLAAMVDSVMVEEKFTITKQDLREVIDRIDENLDDVKSGSIVARSVIENMTVPAVDERLYEVKPIKGRERTEEELAGLPKKPVKASEGLTERQLDRIIEMIDEVRNPVVTEPELPVFRRNSLTLVIEDEESFNRLKKALQDAGLIAADEVKV